MVKPPAEGLDGEVALRRYLADHEADLIHVGGDHDARDALCLVADTGDEGADAVGFYLIGEGSQFASDDGADGTFMASGAEGVGELFEELALAGVGFGSGCHGFRISILDIGRTAWCRWWQLFD